MEIEHFSEQTETQEAEPKQTFSELYYDDIDRKHAEILQQLAVPCQSNHSQFTDLTRIEVIRELLKNTEYKEVFWNTASIWVKGSVDPKIPYFVVSSHCDLVSAITKPFSELNDDGYYHGTYDNIGTNAAAVIAMLEADLPNNVIFSFTADEETGKCSGAKTTTDFIQSLGITDCTYIALDVTAEGYSDGHLATVENAPKQNPEFLHHLVDAMLATEPEQTMTYVKKSKKALPDNLPQEYLSNDTGWYDEAFKYAELGMNKTCSICLPCKGDMHSNYGVIVRQPGFEGYINTLEGMLYYFTKTHEDLIINKKIEKATLFERSKELVEKEKVQLKQKYQTVYSNGNFLDQYYYNSYHSSVYHNDYADDDGYDEYGTDYENEPIFDEELSSFDEYMYGTIDQYDADEEEYFVEDMINSYDPDLYEQYQQLRSHFQQVFQDYQRHIQSDYANPDYKQEEFPPEVLGIDPEDFDNEDFDI